MYASGRWLIDERCQFEERLVKFHLQILCSRAANILGSKKNERRLLRLREIPLELHCSQQLPKLATLKFCKLPLPPTVLRLSILLSVVRFHKSVRVPAVYA